MLLQSTHSCIFWAKLIFPSFSSSFFSSSCLICLGGSISSLPLQDEPDVGVGPEEVEGEGDPGPMQSERPDERSTGRYPMAGGSGGRGMSSFLRKHMVNRGVCPLHTTPIFFVLFMIHLHFLFFHFSFLFAWFSLIFHFYISLRWIISYFIVLVMVSS